MPTRKKRSWTAAEPCDSLAGHRVYRLPKNFGFVAYDATDGAVYERFDDIADELELDLTDGEIERIIRRLPLARTRKKTIRARRPNPYNNLGMVVFGVYDVGSGVSQTLARDQLGIVPAEWSDSVNKDLDDAFAAALAFAQEVQDRSDYDY